MVYLTYNSSIQRPYKYSLCSVASFTNCFLLFFGIAFPFILAYNSQGLWFKTFECSEQPNVTFKNEFFLHVKEGRKDIFWAPDPTFKDKMRVYLRQPLIKTFQEDKNWDKLHDLFNLKLQIGMRPTSEGFNQFQMILIFNYELKCVHRVKMEGAAVIQFNHWQPFSSVKALGELTLHQGRPFTSQDRPERPILPKGSHRLADWSMERIVKEYWTRDALTEMTRIKTAFESRPSAKFFEAEVEVTFPSQKVVYEASFWHVIKWAWIQYLSILTITLYIINKLRRWMFTQGIFATHVCDHYKKIT